MVREWLDTLLFLELQAHSHQGLILDSFNQNYDGLKESPTRPDHYKSDRVEQ